MGKAVTAAEAKSAETWSKINAITGAGVPFSDWASIDITELPADKVAEIDAILGKGKKQTDSNATK